MSIEDLRPLADRAALFTALRQNQLVTATDALGEHRWDADLTAGSLTFSAETDPARQLVGRPHLIASIAPGPRTVLWGWAHPSGDEVAVQLRDYGAQHGVPALTAAEVPFPEGIGEMTAWITEAAHLIGGIAAELTGRGPYFSAPVGGGARAVFVLDGIVPPLTVAEAVPVLPRVLSGLTLPDARTAVWNLARLAAWQLRWHDQSFTGATLQDATGSADFRFDEQARIVGIEGRLGG